MTKTFKITFTHRFHPDVVETIVQRVTDRMEDRPMHKRAVAILTATKKFEKEHLRYTDFNGKPVLLWDMKTEEI